MRDYFLTNCTTDRAKLLLEVATELGIRMYTKPAHDIYGKPLGQGNLAVHLPDGYGDLTEFWTRVRKMDDSVS